MLYTNNVSHVKSYHLAQQNPTLFNDKLTQ